MCRLLTLKAGTRSNSPGDRAPTIPPRLTKWIYSTHHRFFASKVWGQEHILHLQYLCHPAWRRTAARCSSPAHWHPTQAAIAPPANSAATARQQLARPFHPLTRHYQDIRTATLPLNEKIAAAFFGYRPSMALNRQALRRAVLLAETTLAPSQNRCLMGTLCVAHPAVSLKSPVLNTYHQYSRRLLSGAWRNTCCLGLTPAGQQAGAPGAGPHHRLC